MTVSIGVEGLFTTAINHSEIEYARSRRGYVDDIRDETFKSNVIINIVNA